VHNLNDSDYDRPLDEVRDLFWSTPRMPLLPGGDSDLQQAIFEALTAGTLRLLGADGLDRTVTRPGDIGVGQSGLRLARPKMTEPATSEVVGPKAGAAGSEGDSGRVRADGATDTAIRTGGTGASAHEQEVAFSLMSSLTDDTKREAVRLLLRSLTNAVDEGKVSYAQIMIKVVIDSSTADTIREGACEAGANPTVRDI
jgi:hypothetical protein